MTARDIVFHITLGQMGIEDSFWIKTSTHANQTINDLLNMTFPEADADKIKLLNSLDVRTNPDLPDMYLELHALVSGWRKGTREVEFTSSATSEAPYICIEDPVSRYIQSTKDDCSEALWLVIVERFDALAAYQRDFDDQSALIQWMQNCVFLYFIDKHHDQVPSRANASTFNWKLNDIAKRLEALGLLSIFYSNDRYAITHQGRTFIGTLIAETESYIRRFDLFSDILPSYGKRPTIFGSGRGIDLRVQIFISEGIDPYRAVFLLHLYDGTLDAYKDSWWTQINKIKFFNTLLQPIVDHSSVNNNDLQRLVEDGSKHIGMITKRYKTESISTQVTDDLDGAIISKKTGSNLHL